jgi:hypothetical protein
MNTPFAPGFQEGPQWMFLTLKPLIDSNWY